MGRLLDQVESPEDFRNWSLSQLNQLAGEIRSYILEVTSETGGHVGASLGAVELTLALHVAYRTPDDQVIWDIGHQAYGHKILTGRRDRFPTIRQLHGLSGFLKRQESSFDVWEAGHAGTSLSGALGMAVARDLRHASFDVAAVIGDGALTAGMAWEALNQIGHLGTRMVVVVNDNSMSIAPNVGAISRYLTRLRSAPGYARLKQDIEAVMDGIPGLGLPLLRTAERVKDAVRHLMLSGNVFEGLGFKYFGPLDGHDLAELLPVLENARRYPGPVIVHVVTRKGKGYLPAEKHPAEFHGPGPFEIHSGNFIKVKGPVSYSRVFSDTLIQLADQRPDIVAITAAMPDGTQLDRFQARFPDRFFDVGIAEQHATTFAAGLAAQGMHPVFAVYSTFLQRAYDQVVHDVCHQNLPVIFGVDRAGLVGADGATHQGIYDVAYLRTVPNMEIAMGKDEVELQGLLAAALDRPNPVAVRYPRGPGRGLGLAETPEPLPWGKAEWIRHGRDITLVGFGPIVLTALEAADILERAGFDVGVVNARFVKPLDGETLAAVAAETHAMMTLEEHAVAGGFGSAVLEWAAQQGVAIPILMKGLPDTFIDHGPAGHFLDLYGLSVSGIVRSVESWLGEKKRRA